MVFFVLWDELARHFFNIDTDCRGFILFNCLVFVLSIVVALTQEIESPCQSLHVRRHLVFRLRFLFGLCLLHKLPARWSAAFLSTVVRTFIVLDEVSLVGARCIDWGSLSGLVAATTQSESGATEEGAQDTHGKL